MLVLSESERSWNIFFSTEILWSISLSLLTKMTMCKVFVKVELTWVLPYGGHRTGDGGVGVCSQWVCRGGVSWQEVLKLNRNWRSRNTAQIIQNKTVIFFDSNDPVSQILLTSSQHHRASPNCLNLISKDTTKKLQTVNDYYCTYVNVKKKNQTVSCGRF